MYAMRPAPLSPPPCTRPGEGCSIASPCLHRCVAGQESGLQLTATKRTYIKACSALPTLQPAHLLIEVRSALCLGAALGRTWSMERGAVGVRTNTSSGSSSQRHAERVAGTGEVSCQPCVVLPEGQRRNTARGHLTAALLPAAHGSRACSSSCMRAHGIVQCALKLDGTASISLCLQAPGWCLTSLAGRWVKLVRASGCCLNCGSVAPLSRSRCRVRCFLRSSCEGGQWHTTGRSWTGALISVIDDECSLHSSAAGSCRP